MLPMSKRDSASAVEAVRRFNRFYTRRIGVLDEALLGSGLSLAEARVLWELGHEPGVTATALGARLSIDAGYLSRILRAFRARGWLGVRPAPRDARVRHLALTAAGRRRLAPLERGSRAQVAAMLADLGPTHRGRLLEAMGTVEALLDPAAALSPAFEIRAPRAGDFGWIVERHGALYAAERGWGPRFEGLVAEIVADFLRAHDPGRERAWIAQRGAERIGTVMLVRGSARVAQLRLLLVEPAARGLGVGSRLVDECIAFARAAGYARLMLWTQSVLVPARRLYAGKGLRLARREKHREFGVPLTGESWELALG